VAFNGSGTIDSTGIFVGTILIGSETKAGGYVWVTDKTGFAKVSATSFTQRAGATPRSTVTKPGLTVTVDLVDFTAADVIAVSEVTIGNVQAASVSGTTTVPATGSTSTLAPFKFVIPDTVGEGVHRVVIAPGNQSAMFNLDVTH
jgi:hypothetical protein